MNEGCAMTRVWRGYASLKMLQQSSTNILLVGAWVAPPSRLSFSDEIPALSMQQPLEVASFPAGIHFMLTSTCRANITARYTVLPEHGTCSPRKPAHIANGAAGFLCIYSLGHVENSRLAHLLLWYQLAFFDALLRFYAPPPPTPRSLLPIDR